jgi:(2Fe-2S) ferredoxin
MDLYNLHRQPHFSLEGQFLGFIQESGGKLKYLRVAVGSTELTIKLSKESRVSLNQVLMPGDWIQIFGETKLKKCKDEPKFKAYQINKLYQNSEISPSASPKSDRSRCTKPKAKILVCQKSGCQKRGAKKLCQELEAVLCDRGLQDSVEIERTGCQKRCSSAPNMMLMPSKTRCSKMHPNEVADLVAQHLLQN